MTSAVATDIVVDILKNIIDKLDISVNKINNAFIPVTDMFLTTASRQSVDNIE